MAKAEAKGVKLLLPGRHRLHHRLPDPIDAPVETKVYPVTGMPADMEAATSARHHEAVCRRGQGFQDRGLERPHGRV